MNEASTEVKAALQLQPDAADTHHNYELALYDTGDHSGAITEFHTAIRLKPDYGNAHYNLAHTPYALGDYEGALAEYRAAARLMPTLPEGHYNYGNCLPKKVDYDGAISKFRAAVSRCESNDIGSANPPPETLNSHAGMQRPHSSDCSAPALPSTSITATCTTPG